MVFGHFFEIGQLDLLDIAYCDSTKCYSTSEILALITCLNQFLASYTCLVFLPDWIFAIFKQGAFVQVHSHN